MLRLVSQRVVASRINAPFALCVGLATASAQESTPTCSAAAAGRLVGKTAVVFGGTSGIGLATSIALRKEGAQVLAISRTPDKAAGVAQENGLSLASCDVRDRDALQILFQKQGTIDILISAATGGERYEPPARSGLWLDSHGSNNKLTSCVCVLCVRVCVSRSLLSLSLALSLSPSVRAAHSSRWTWTATARPLTSCGGMPTWCALARHTSPLTAALSSYPAAPHAQPNRSRLRRRRDRTVRARCRCGDCAAAHQHRLARHRHDAHVRRPLG